ncbi:MAG: hypothetical protein ACP5MZ_00935 [Candidatus Micrarchaeia archaeon]
MERDYIEMISSLTAIIVSIIAVAVFIYYGGNALFYVVVVIAILLAAFNAWLLSNEDNLKSVAGKISFNELVKAQKAKQVPRKRKKAHRKRNK